MPRPINFALLDLFDYNNLNKIICNHGCCKGRVLYRHGGNLQRHLKSLHPRIYLSYLENKTVLQDQGGFYMQKQLIDLVRDKPILWDASSISVSNRNLYIQTWDEISHQLNLNVEICKQKWKNLRNYFRKETSTIYPESDPTLTSSWQLFSSLLFLQDEVLDQESSENMQKEEEIESLLNSIKEESYESDMDGSRMELMACKSEEDECLEKNNNTYEKQSQKRSAYNDKDIGKPEVKIIKPELKNENDEEKMFLLSLLPYLKTIPENRRLLVRHRIQGVLLEDKANSSVLLESTF